MTIRKLSQLSETNDVLWEVLHYVKTLWGTLWQCLLMLPSSAVIILTRICSKWNQNTCLHWVHNSEKSGNIPQGHQQLNGYMRYGLCIQRNVTQNPRNEFSKYYDCQTNPGTKIYTIQFIKRSVSILCA